MLLSIPSSLQISRSRNSLFVKVILKNVVVETLYAVDLARILGATVSIEKSLPVPGPSKAVAFGFSGSGHCQSTGSTSDSTDIS